MPQLTLDEYARYGRQMTVPELGRPGQDCLGDSRVLVVGAGGLGSPAIMYLAGAGVGTLGIVDDDCVEVLNLHRQVIHLGAAVGTPKCHSAQQFVERMNPHVRVVAHHTRLTVENARTIFASYTLVLDCSDTPHTRYLVLDTAVALGIPVVSGLGLGVEGQLTVLNYNGGPCYRCFYPTPPPPNTVTLCRDGGVLGPAIGLVGVMMAMEAIKVATNSYAEFKPFLSVYSAYPQQLLRTFTMRGRRATCAACGDHPTITDHEDYSAFCGKVDYNVASPELRVLVEQLQAARPDATVLDVRPAVQYGICSLEDSVNVPLSELVRMAPEAAVAAFPLPVYVVCRYGNDSQLAGEFLRAAGCERVFDVVGGLDAWSERVDPTFPRY